MIKKKLVILFVLFFSYKVCAQAKSNVQIIIKIDNEIINLLYQQYSKAIPFIGKYIVGSSRPYDYLIKSINDFYTQDELADLMKKNGFSNIEYRNLSNGISAIHSGWKI